jgi:hypothetical protein
LVVRVREVSRKGVPALELEEMTMDEEDVWMVGPSVILESEGLDAEGSVKMARPRASWAVGGVPHIVRRDLAEFLLRGVVQGAVMRADKAQHGVTMLPAPSGQGKSSLLLSGREVLLCAAKEFPQVLSAYGDGAWVVDLLGHADVRNVTFVKRF